MQTQRSHTDKQYNFRNEEVSENMALEVIETKREVSKVT